MVSFQGPVNSPTTSVTSVTMLIGVRLESRPVLFCFFNISATFWHPNGKARLSNRWYGPNVRASPLATLLPLETDTLTTGSLFAGVELLA